MAVGGRRSSAVAEGTPRSSVSRPSRATRIRAGARSDPARVPLPRSAEMPTIPSTQAVLGLPLCKIPVAWDKTCGMGARRVAQRVK